MITSATTASRNTPSTSPPARLRLIMSRPEPGTTVAARVAPMARPNVRRVCRVTLVRRVTLRRGIGGVTSVGRSSSLGVRAGAAAGRLPLGVPGPRALVRLGPARRSPTASGP